MGDDGAGLPVAVDAMGGDNAPEAIVAGAVQAAREGLPVTLVGDEHRVRALLPPDAGVAVVHAPDAIAMDESPGTLRHREGASIRVALDLVERGEASAAVSCGNSGAILVAAVLDGGVLPGVERPAIGTVLPRSDGGRLVLVDAGANVDARPEHLASFALLGSAYAQALGVQAPRVGLVANGEEPGKGNEQVRAAAALLEALPIAWVGNVEPPAAFAGACDVLVCDGFVGNVMLKTVEGAAETVWALMKEEIRRHPSARFGAWLLQRALRRFRARVAWEAVGGGVLLGCSEIIVVGHGRATAVAVHSAIALAHRAAREGLVDHLRRRLAVTDPAAPNG